MGKRWLGSVVAGAVVFGAAACGGGDDQGGVASAGGAAATAAVSPTRSLSPEDAELKFAQCMRQNGVDVPDPGSGQGMRLGKNGDQEKAKAALKKCRQWLQAGGKMPDLKDPKVRDQYVKLAQCMREHGVDIKDPKPDGTLVIPSTKVDPETAEKAREACRNVLPGAGK